MGQSAYTNEQLKKALKKATKAVELKPMHSQRAEIRANKAFSKTLRRVRKIFNKLEETDGADAYCRIADAYLELVEEEECVKPCIIEQYKSMAKIHYEDAYEKCVAERREYAKKMLIAHFALRSIILEDGSEYLCYFSYNGEGCEFRGTTYYLTDPLVDPDILSRYFLACTKDDRSNTVYRRVTSKAEQEDVRKAYFSR